MTKNNILYFEGAGMFFNNRELESSFSDVGNFRIRTSFKNLDGRQIYLELGNGKELGKRNTLKRMFLTVDFCFYVPEDKEQEINYSELYDIRNEHLKPRKLDYTKNNIIKWINENLNCNFDSMEVLDQFYGYHVHNGDRTYNLMEDITINHKKAEARKQAYENKLKEYTIILKRKYPAISIKEMTDDYMILDNHQSDKLLKKYGLPSRYEKVIV